MGNEKILLAKMYYDEYLSMPREPAGVNEKLEKYKKKFLTMPTLAMSRSR